MDELEGRNEQAEQNGNSIGTPTVSTNPDRSELPETKPPTKEHMCAAPWPHSLTQQWPCLASMGEGVPNPAKT